MTIPPATLDLTVYQGATFREHFTWADEADAPVNLTGYTARMHVRPAAGSPKLLLELTTENGGITLGGGAGTVLVHASATTTAALEPGGGYYDIELVAADGTVTRLLMGRLYISQEVTR